MKEFILSSFTEKKVQKLYQKYKNTNKKILIYCAGDLTEYLLQNYSFLKELNILGIIDGNQNKHGIKVDNIEIYSPEEIQNLKPDVIIISTIHTEIIKKIIKKIRSENNLKFKIISNLYNTKLDTHSLYRTKKIIRDYCKLPSFVPLIAHYQHGWLIGYPFLESDFISAKKDGLMLVFNKRHLKEWKEKTDLPAIIIGSPFCHYRRMNNITKDINAKGTIAFPAHSSTNKQIITIFDRKQYLSKLFSLPEEYHPITICSFFSDLEDWQKIKEFSEFDFKLVTAGHSWSDNFTENFYNFLKQHKYSTSNNSGSHILYSLDLGLPFFFWGEKAQYYKDTKYIEDSGYRELYNKRNIISIKPIKEITEEQKKFLEEETGLLDCLNPLMLKIVLLKNYFSYIIKNAFKNK